MRRSLPLLEESGGEHLSDRASYAKLPRSRRAARARGPAGDGTCLQAPQRSGGALAWETVGFPVAPDERGRLVPLGRSSAGYCDGERY
jgi:hypothetical protein